MTKSTNAASTANYDALLGKPTTVQEIQDAAAASTALATAPEHTEVSLASALHIGQHFATNVRYSEDQGSAMRKLTWSTGNNDCFAPNGKTALPSAKGWYIDKPDTDEMFPDDYEFIDAMERLCEAGVACEVVVAHTESESTVVRKVPAWHLPIASLLVMCEGVPSHNEMVDPNTRWGIAYGWGAKSHRTQLRFRCFIKELLDAGYNGGFAVSLSSYVASKMLTCLKAQEYVLRFVDDLRAKANESDGVAYYAFALPVRCSVNTIAATNKETGKTTQVYYPIPAIPRLSHRDLEQAMEYLRHTAITIEQGFLIENGGRVEDAVTWSIEESRRILTGNDAGEDIGVTEDAGVVDADGKPLDRPF